MSKTIGLACAVALAAIGLGSAGCGGGGEEGEAAGTATVQLAEQSGSGESGTATLTAMGDQTKVVIDLSNAPAEPQPAHIHAGTCDNIGDVEAALTNVVNGNSETTVDEPLGEITEETYAINVHKSEAEFDTYVACGNTSGATSSERGEGDGY